MLYYLITGNAPALLTGQPCIEVKTIAINIFRDMQKKKHCFWSLVAENVKNKINQPLFLLGYIFMETSQKLCLQVGNVR